VASLDILSILFIAVALSSDCFAVALSGSISMGAVSSAQILRTSLVFGAFQALMLVLGWLAGQAVVNLIADYDHWVAFVLLAIVGSRMIRESFRPGDSKKIIDITRGSLLLILALATSIDALAVGLTFAFLEVNIALASSITGAIALAVTVIGFLLGRKAGKLLGKRAELVGGIILISIGFRILLSHIL
jgi:putative Mn2+ efflux pump MntP